MTILSKTAASLSLFSSIRDIHKTAVMNSNNAYAKASSDTFIETSVAAQKANRISAKDAARKNWILKNNFFGGINEVLGRIGGYITGALSASVSYIPNFILGGIAMFSKEKLATFATIGLGIVELFDFIKNSSGLFERSDYLK